MFRNSMIALAAILLSGASFYVMTNKNSMQKKQLEMPIKAIISDVGGVLLHTQNLPVLWHIGPTNILRFCTQELATPLAIHDRVCDLLAHMGEKEGSTSATFKGMPLPISMYQWQKGKMSTREIEQKIADAIDTLQRPESTKAILRAALPILTDCQTQVQTKAYNAPITSIIQEIAQQKKHKLIVLSNMEKELVVHVKSEFAALFDLFDDFIASGEVGMIKPEAHIFIHVLEKHGLTAQECLFIDDLAENIAAARALGMHTFHMCHGSQGALRTYLEELHIL